MSDDLIARAREFATAAHERIDQRRKYTNQPYHEHLKSVATLVGEVADDDPRAAGSQAPRRR